MKSIACPLLWHGGSRPEHDESGPASTSANVGSVAQLPPAPLLDVDPVVVPVVVVPAPPVPVAVVVVPVVPLVVVPLVVVPLVVVPLVVVPVAPAPPVPVPDTPDPHAATRTKARLERSVFASITWNLR
jgi:hypothetical protein